MNKGDQMARERRNAETKIFSLPGGQEVLCIYCWPAMEGDQVHYTVTYPSRRVDPASPEALREYAAVWAEAAAWLAGAAEQSEATLDGPNPFEAGIQEAREQ